MFVIIRAEYDGRPASAIPSFFRGRKYNGRLALRRGESRVTSLEARVRRLQLSERGRAMLNAGPWSCPFAPHEGQKAWKSGRSQNEGIPEPSWICLMTISSDFIVTLPNLHELTLSSSFPSFQNIYHVSNLPKPIGGSSLFQVGRAS